MPLDKDWGRGGLDVAIGNRVVCDATAGNTRAEDKPKMRHPKITVFWYQILATKAEDCRFVIISLLFLIISISIAPNGR